jgi:hypothetical protein
VQVAVGSGGSGDLEGVAALISAIVVALGFVLSLFRSRAPSGDVKQEILHAVEEELLEARQTALLNGWRTMIVRSGASTS